MSGRKAAPIGGGAPSEGAGLLDGAHCDVARIPRAPGSSRGPGLVWVG